MQRVRTSLPYFKELGWAAEVVCVDEKHSDIIKDDLLLLSLPAGEVVHKIGAFSKTWTSRAGIGSLALRSLWFFATTVSGILGKSKFDLVYFSTTQFPVCVLGAYWKKRFGIPYVIDMQDPWHSDYYKDKPKAHQPRKYWFSYRLNKYLEPLAIKNVSGLISVSEQYISDLKQRYPVIKDIPSAPITFGAYEADLRVADDNSNRFEELIKPGFKNIVYVGRGGMDMHKAISPVFDALRKGLEDKFELFNALRFYFIGTSYAPAGQGVPTILPLAKQYGVEKNVIEITDRISYYHALSTLQEADILFIPGSDDPKYTASKIYPYLLTKKPLLAIFNSKSNAIEILNECVKNAIILTFDDSGTNLTDTCYEILLGCAKGQLVPLELSENFDNYSARNLAAKQTELFEQAIKHHEAKNTKP
jgi:hypothetical protein